MSIIEFIKPIDGDVLFEVADGMVKDGFLHTNILISAPDGADVTVNGVKAEKTADGFYLANSHWLRFSFHSLADKPDSPYKNATYEQVMNDGRMIERVFRGVKWCVDNGYRSSWISDFALEKLPGRK